MSAHEFEADPPPIEALTVRGLGPFAEAITVPFAPCHGRSQVLALTGRRGKTWALRALALGLSGWSVAAQAPGDGLLTRAASRGEARIRFVGVDASGGFIEAVTGYAVNGQGRAEIAVSESHRDAGREDAFVVAYGAGRSRWVERSLVPLSCHHASRLVNDHPWWHIGDLWPPGDRAHGGVPVQGLFDELWRRQTLTGGGPSFLARAIDAQKALRGALASALGATATGAEGGAFAVNGEPAGQWGDGRRSLAAWVCDMMARWVDREWAAGRTVAPGFEASMRGVAIVDAVDEGLHPAEQFDVLARLRETFPAMTFAVSVTSPLTLAPLLPGEVVVLRDRGGGVAVDVPSHNPQVLTGPELMRRYFDFEPLFPGHMSAVASAYRKLARNPNRTDAVEARLRNAVEHLTMAGAAPGFPPVPRRGDGPAKKSPAR